MSTDGFGCAISYADADAVDAFTDAARKLLGFRPDPIAELRGLLAAHPDFLMARCVLAGAFLVASDQRLQPMLATEFEVLIRHERSANDRERGHINALRHWLAGDWYGASAAYSDILAAYPRDLCALLFGHQVDFLLGQGARSQDRAARVLAYWRPDEVDGGFIHGMLAFGLEECGHYARAEQAAERALALNPHDTWAIHGRAHCFEMQGQVSDGIAFMSSREGQWGGDNYLAAHNAWHLALMHIELTEHQNALDLHDRYMRIDDASVLMKMHDSCALLWRLSMCGVDGGNRWQVLSRRYEEVAEQSYMGFTDLHSALTFIATENYPAADRLIAAVRAEAAGNGDRANIARLSTLPIVEGMYAFAHGNYEQAMQRLAASRYSSALFGGSAAQRDIVTLTYLEAAIRGGRRDIAEALLAERRLFKPDSPFTEFIRSRLDPELTSTATRGNDV